VWEAHRAKSLPFAGIFCLTAIAFNCAYGQLIRSNDAAQPTSNVGDPAVLKNARSRLPASPDVILNLEDQVEIQKTRVEMVKAKLANAQLERERAELMLEEYEKAGFAGDKSALEDEIEVARAEFEAAKKHVPEAKDWSEQIHRASKGTSSDLFSEFRFEDQAAIAQMEASKARLALKQLQWQLKKLLEYTKPQHTKELRAAVERAKSVEMAGQAQVRLSQSRLTGLQGQKTPVVALPVEPARALVDFKDQYVNQRVTTVTTQGSYENAKLTREIAEIGIAEYVQGIFVQDKANLEGERLLAQSEIDRARLLIQLAKDRLERITKASSGTIGDLAAVFSFHDQVASFTRRLPRAELAAKKVASKLKILSDYTKAERIMELKAAVEKARVDELAKKADWQTELAREKRLNQSITALEQPAK
jgi:hypothetical protein